METLSETDFSIDEVQRFVNDACKHIHPIIINGLGSDGNFRKQQSYVHADHIGFDCASHKEFLAIGKQLRSSGQVEGEHTESIRGRDVTVFKLCQPMDRLVLPWASSDPQHACRYLELSDQDAEGSQQSGVSSIEMSYYGPEHFGTSELSQCFRKAGYVFTPKTREGFEHQLLYLSLLQANGVSFRVYFITGQGIGDIVGF